jgi:3-hydroxyacyl-[acyl-carrier-protein] dehydratase
MPPQFLFDISGIDLNRVLFDAEHIRLRNPQRGPLAQLDAIVHVDREKGQIIGYKDLTEHEFWIPYHIPGRPLMPGVLMIESGAQLAGFYYAEIEKWEGFIGFSGVDDVRFRAPIPPGKRFYLLAKVGWVRHGRFCSKIQGLIDGALVFEATILGMRI